jgi:hypothetical protein
MSVDLVLDLVGGVRHVDGRVGVRGGHLGLCTLERWQELAVQEAWLRVFELVGNVSRQPELSTHVISMNKVQKDKKCYSDLRMGPGQWHKGSNRGCRASPQRSGGTSWRTKERLGRQRSGICQCCPCWVEIQIR